MRKTYKGCDNPTCILLSLPKNHFKNTSDRTKFLVCAGFVFISVWAVYFHTLNAPFQLDDFGRIVQNPTIKHLSNLKALWLYEPERFLTQLSFALNYRMHGLSLPGFHLVNIFIHSGCSLWVMGFYYFLTSIGKDEYTSAHPVWIGVLAAGLTLALHPVQTQAVLYLTQRAVLLAAFFYLGALFFYLRFRLSGAWANFALAGFFALCAFGSKESAASLTLVLISLEFFILSKRKLSGVSWQSILPFMFLTLIIPLLYSLSSTESGERKLWQISGSFQSVGLGVHFMSQVPAILTYFRLILFPWPLRLEYDLPLVHSPSEIIFLSSLGGLVSLVFLSVLLLKSRPRALFSLSVIAAGILPEILFAPVEKDLVFEHRLYFPMIGFALICADLFTVLARRKRIFAPAALAMVSICWGTMTFARAVDWNNPITFLKREIHYAPAKVRPYVNLSTYYMNLGRIAEARDILKSAAVFSDADDRVLNNLALIEFEQGHDEEAARLFRRAAEIAPWNDLVYYNLGRIELRKKSWSAAESYFRQALSRNPHSADGSLGLAQALLSQGKLSDARRYAHQAVFFKPEDPLSYYYLARAQISLGDDEDARKNLLEALRLSPGLDEARNNLAVLYYKSGEFEESESQLRIIIRENELPDTAYFNLANVLHAAGQEDEGREAYEKALEAARDRQKAGLTPGNWFFRLPASKSSNIDTPQ